MEIEKYDCDMVHVLQNGDFTILEKLSSFCSEFRKDIIQKFANATSSENEYAQTKKSYMVKISELKSQLDTLKSKMDDVMLKQKIVDKKITNTINQEETLEKDIAEIKTNRDALSLELVDLKQEVQERREKKCNEWNALKKATNIYKSILNFGIDIEHKEDYDEVKVSFFRNYEYAKDKYYVNLINEDKLWKVKEIHPTIKKEHLIDLKGTVDFDHDQSWVSNITAFLCLLRIVFLKYYMDGN
ncbi:PREDICTED: uncharacterized protein LOC107074625 [Polistes dominula]|uniref:Uncharacterized protein LOC107074625 n=1 Tax=Polistes dominula TaxID=743375 RepID=A0ABM1JGX2_POLDO|nr:PREDICTED: uncharacterized protein LOC107074625 [Polistes dominula]